MEEDPPESWEGPRSEETSQESNTKRNQVKSEDKAKTGGRLRQIKKPVKPKEEAEAKNEAQSGIERARSSEAGEKLKRSAKQRQHRERHNR